MENLGRQVTELKVEMVLLWSNTSTLADLDSHGSRHDIPTGQIFGGRCVVLHETLAITIE